MDSRLRGNDVANSIMTLGDIFGSFSDITLKRDNVTYLPLDFENPVIPQLLHALYARKIYSLLVEGGACLHTSFFDSGLWDELQIETSPVQLGFGVKSAMLNPNEIADFHKNIHFPSETSRHENQSVISIYFNKHKI